jgi:hypothetical protein
MGADGLLQSQRLFARNAGTPMHFLANSDEVDMNLSPHFCRALSSRDLRPPLPPRLFAGLLYAQFTIMLTDEEVVWG